MTPRRLLATTFFLAFLMCQYLLLTGSPLLNLIVSTALELPLGALVAWLALIGLPAALLLAAFEWLGRHATALLGFALLLAVPWGGISRLLSGNWHYNFSASAESFIGSSQAAETWWFYSMLTGLLPLAVLFIAGLYRVAQVLRRSD